MTNKEKFLALVSKEETNTLEKNRTRIKNRAMLRESQQIAIKVLKKLDELGWSQIRLAKELKVSPQQVNKIVKGQENLTLETQQKLQTILDIPILATYYESKMDSKEELTLNIGKRIQHFDAVNSEVPENYSEAKVIRMDINVFSDQYSYQAAVNE